MAGELEAAVRDIFDGLERKDLEAVMRITDDEVQGVDENSRRWLRGRDELAEYLRGLLPMVENTQTELQDVRETIFGDAGVLTCWIEQSYILEGKPEHVSAPTTVIFRRRDGGWKMVLFHSIPLAEG